MRVQLYLAGLTLVLFYAMWKGGGPERAVGWILIAMGGTTTLARLVFPPTFVHLDEVVLGSDFAALVALLLVALRASRFWPLCVCSLQIVSLVAHLARALDYSIHPKVYWLMAIGPSYPIIALLALGTWRHQRRLRLSGRDPSWRNLSEPSPPLMPRT